MLKFLRSTFAVFLLVLPTAYAAPAAKNQLVLAVSEGTSGGITAEAGRAKYQPLADALGLAIHADVKVNFVREFAALEKGMKEHQFDLVIARPSDYPARGMLNDQYQFVATAQPDGRCMLIVHKDSPLKTVNELHGRTFILPEESAYMSRFCRAELREQGIRIAQEKVHFVREQGAIPFAIENKISDVGGVASYSGAYGKWIKDGHRVLFESRTQPYMPVVASPKLSGEEVSKLQAMLVALTSDESGQQILKRIGIKGFIGTEEAKLRKLPAWLDR